MSNLDTKQSPVPIRLRPVTDDSIGTTAFFRNRPLFDTLLTCLKNDVGCKYRVLFHACSIGAEVYSLIIRYLWKQYEKEYQLQCFATDHEKGFIDFAAEAHYPEIALNGMSDGEKAFFEIKKGGVVPFSDVRNRVEFISPTDFSDYSSPVSYDVVFLLNALVYVPVEVQKKTIEKISKYNSSYLVLTAFHMDTIRENLEEYGYEPVLENQELIHESWLDRRVKLDGDVRNSKIFADWRLPAFSEIKNHEFKYCSIFKKNR